ncbi:Efflux pump dotC [Vanrija pseudolonga]|uniref:Efflux pump dotC n=1 Tax=Vanrija pseudolonga TaxID=143232 RepID=A0AAF1BPB1_9TREE|nr:Efflux pump dotC [Vanrija pseudolonga]
MSSTPQPQPQAGPSSQPDALSRPPSRSTRRPQPARQLSDNALTRTPSSHSFHAGHSLRRMATHETGEFVDVRADGARMSTHDEHDGEHEDGASVSSQSRTQHKDEEAAIEAHGKGGSDSRDANLAASAKPDDGDHHDDKYALQDQTNLLPWKQVAVIFVGLNCALFCSLLDQTIVTTALPTLGRVFNQASIASWVGTAYMLTSTALQPVYGRLSDIFGRKSVLLGSLTIFFFGSLACALARTMIQLIIFRAIQGVGGGGILTLAMIIISDVVSLKDRGKYQGITGGVVAIANSAGPILGGIFTEKVTWRWCFYINLPLTALAIIVIVFLLPLKKVHGSMREKLAKLDYYGSLLTLAWAVLVLLALSWGGTEHPWSSAAVIAPLVIGGILLFVFIFVEARLVPLPLIPMYIFRNKTVAASMATTFANGAAFYATLYYLPQYFQVVRGESPIQSGVHMLPLVFVQVFFSFSSGFLVSKTGDYKWNLMAGFFIWTIGLGLLSTLHPDTSMARIYGFQVLVGVGAGQTFQTSLIAIQASVERKDMATATGCRNFLRMLGGTVALAACTAIVNNIARVRMAGDGFDAKLVSDILSSPTELAVLGLDAAQIELVRAAYSKGINACFYFCVPLVGACFFITVFFIDRVNLKREDDAKLKAEAKAWVAEQKERKRHGSQHGSRHASSETVHVPTEKAEVKPSPPASERTLNEGGGGELKRVKSAASELEAAAKGLEEAAGVATESTPTPRT